MSFLRFCAVGVINTAVGLGLIFSLMRFGGVQYVVANAIGYAVGTVVSFFLNRSWTFYHKGPVLSSAVRWFLVIAIAYGANVCAVIVSHEYFGIDRYISQLSGMVAYTSLSYLGGRFYAFAPKLNLST
ncbi:MAG TPA: GtrA family protein [Roseiarcus sp.]|jgi:putative flippase GtrA